MRVSIDPTRVPAEIIAAMDRAVEEYEERRERARAFIARGGSPAAAARRFHVPIGFARYCKREESTR